MIACYVAGAVTWPKLKLHFIELRSDPMGTIKADMHKLQEAKDRLLNKGSNDPPNPPNIPRAA